MAIRVLIVDDQQVTRDVLRSVIAQNPLVSIVAEAAGADEALTLSMRLHPDVVLMDLRMPGRSGIEAARDLAREVPATRVLFVALDSDPHWVEAALGAGAAGYVAKGDVAAELFSAIDQVHGGSTYLSQQVRNSS